MPPTAPTAATAPTAPSTPTDESIGASLSLRPGTHIFGGGGSWCVLTPDEEMISVEVDDDVMSQVLDRIEGGRVRTEGSDLAAPPAVGQTIAGLVELGLLEPDQRDDRTFAVRIAVHPGGEQVAEAVQRLLEAAMSPPLDLLDLAGVGPADQAAAMTSGLVPDQHLIACADRPPDAVWSAVDDRCRSAGLGWHRVAREGKTILVGPPTFPIGADPSYAERPPGYRDTRIRRLAASSWPDQLLASWDWVTSGRPTAGGLHAGSAQVAVAAALIAADIAAMRTGAAPPGAGRLSAVAPDLAILRHPVLALPDYLLASAP